MKRSLITRIGIAFIFIVFGVWEIVQPKYWEVFVPEFLGFLDRLLLVKIHGVVLLVLGIGILAGFQLKKLGIAAVLILLSIVFSVWLRYGFSDILIRDIVILLFASTLILDE